LVAQQYSFTIIEPMALEHTSNPAATKGKDRKFSPQNQKNHFRCTILLETVGYFAKKSLWNTFHDLQNDGGNRERMAGIEIGSKGSSGSINEEDVDGDKAKTTKNVFWRRNNKGVDAHQPPSLMFVDGF
jgi:hypothetical protein